MSCKMLSNCHSLYQVLSLHTLLYSNPPTPLLPWERQETMPCKHAAQGHTLFARGFWRITPILTSQTIPLARPWQVQILVLDPARALDSAPALALQWRHLMVLTLLVLMLGLLGSLQGLGLQAAQH